jgi:hypothetical protein
MLNGESLEFDVGSRSNPHGEYADRAVGQARATSGTVRSG